jgi:surface antigen
MFAKRCLPFVLIALLSACMASKENGGDPHELRIDPAKLSAGGVGSLLGALTDRDVWAAMTGEDRNQADQAAKRAFAAPLAEKVIWTNPQSGNSGTITTTREGYSSAGTFCREFQQTVTTPAKSELAYGTACKQPDATWKIMAK